MGTAGHVDHGKTALINALTGIDCDTHKAEKERGITINLGFAHLEMESGVSLGVVDVPGHKDFIRTMVAGAYGIDFVLLVVAADSGIMPQTREHFNIMRMLGINRGIIALNKADLVDEEMLELAKLELMEYLEGSPMENAPIVAVSALTGLGMDDLKNEIDILARQIPEKSHIQEFRLFVDRIFNVKGQGIVVTGSVLGGQVLSGQELFLLPGNKSKVRIKSIQRHGMAVESVAAGDRAALNLAGLKYDDFERGMILSDRQLEETSLVDARLELFDVKARLKLWSHIIFYTGTFATKARVHLLTEDKLAGNEAAVVQIHIEKPAILLNGDKFIIRNSSNDLSLGGGTILDVNPLHHRRKTKVLKQNMEVLATAILNQENRFQLMMLEMEKAARPLKIETLAASINQAAEAIEDTVNENAGSLHIIETGDGKYLVSHNHKDKMAGRIVEDLRTYHSQNKLFARGLDSKELSGKLAINSSAESELLTQVLNDLLAKKKIKAVGKTFALKSHEVKPDKKMQEQINWLEHLVEGNGLQRLTLDEIEKKAQNEGIRRGMLKMLLQFMAGQNMLHFDGEDVLAALAVDKVRRQLLKQLAGKPKGINEKEFRELINAPKKTVQVLIAIFIKEEIISKETFYLHLTEKGRLL